MDIEALRKYCLSLPHTTEIVQWGNDLLFRIGGKMNAVVGLESSEGGVAFKCTPDEFAQLTERDGIIPAPYLARYHWVQVRDSDALTQTELKRLLRDSYQMVRAKLPKKVRDQLK